MLLKNKLVLTLGHKQDAKLGLQREHPTNDLPNYALTWTFSHCVLVQSREVFQKVMVEV